MPKRNQLMKENSPINIVEIKIDQKINDVILVERPVAGLSQSLVHSGDTGGYDSLILQTGSDGR